MNKDNTMVECYICKALGRRQSTVMLPLSEAVRVRGPGAELLFRHKKHNSETLKKFALVWEKTKREEQEKKHPAPTAEMMDEIRDSLLNGAVSSALMTLRNYAGLNGMSVSITFDTKG